MVCLLTCAIAYALLGANIWTMMVDDKYEKNLLNTLTDEQKKIHDEIVSDRMKLYLHGLVLGLIIALFIIYKFKLSMTSSICLFIAIVGLTQVIYYELMPKKKWMLDYLDNSEQNKAWLAIYKEMKSRWHYGFIGGLIIYGIICYGLLKN